MGSVEDTLQNFQLNQGSSLLSKITNGNATGDGNINVLVGNQSHQLPIPVGTQRFQMTKTCQKLHMKICKIVWVRLMLATIWQVSEMQCMQSPETEIMQICWNQFWKNSWKHIRWNYFWRVLVIWHLCASPPLLHSPPYWSCWRCTVFPILYLCSEMFILTLKCGFLVAYNLLDLWDGKWRHCRCRHYSCTLLHTEPAEGALSFQLCGIWLGNVDALWCTIYLQMWLPTAYNLPDLPLGFWNGALNIISLPLFSMQFTWSFRLGCELSFKL